jgi:hypothetical protein
VGKLDCLSFRVVLSAAVGCAEPAL